MKQKVQRSLSLVVLSLISLVSVSAVFLTSCNKNKNIRSLTEMLNDEKKWVSQFIAQKQFQVADGWDGQNEFDPHTFYKFNNGLYIQVLDAGKEKPIAEKTRIKVRFKGYFFNPDSINGFDNLSKGNYQNTEFLYVNRYVRGAVHYVLLPSAMGNTLNDVMCEGVAFPMSLLGNGARVRLIVPFLIGPEVAYNLGYPMYCEEVRYEFIN